MDRVRKFYQIRHQCYQIVKDGDIYYLYILADGVSIRIGCPPWIFIKRFNNECETIQELRKITGISSDLNLYDYEIKEDLIDSKINHYKYS